MLNLEKLLRIPDVDIAGGYSLLNDGTRLAFSWNKSGSFEIYEMNLDDPLQIKQLSYGAGGKITPRYSPNGNFIAWVYDANGSENFHIIIYDRISGITRDLTPDINYSIQPLFAWSPDSRYIACMSDISGNYDLYIISVDSLENRFLYSAGGPAHFVRWSPDGNYLAVTAEKEWQKDGTYVIPLNEGSVHRIGGEQDPIDACYPAWSPDSSKLVFTSNTSGWSQIGIYNLSNHHITWLTDDHSDKYNPTWSPDGKLLAWINNYAETAWVKITSINGAMYLINTEPGFSYWPLFSSDGKFIYFIYENPHQPPDLWRSSLTGIQLIQLTESLPPDIERNDFVEPLSIKYPSLDGTPIPALLYIPKNASPKSPGVVLVHGGPAFHLGFYWYPFVAYLVSRGWVVIGPNYRGSTGYGRDWLVSNRYELGRLDSDDCVAAAIYLREHGYADPLKIAITGRSHGGYLTMTCMTRNPEIFAVGSAVVPFLNWFTSHENSREDLQYWDRLNMGDPTINQDLWKERSPFFFLDRVQAPVQFICGENDPRCPPSESVTAYNRLIELGIYSELLLYPNEGHGFLILTNIIESEKKRVEFLANILEK